MSDQALDLDLPEDQAILRQKLAGLLRYLLSGIDQLWPDVVPEDVKAAWWGRGTRRARQAAEPMLTAACRGLLTFWPMVTCDVPRSLSMADIEDPALAAIDTLQGLVPHFISTELVLAALRRKSSTRNGTSKDGTNLRKIPKPKGDWIDWHKVREIRDCLDQLPEKAGQLARKPALKPAAKLNLKGLRLIPPDRISYRGRDGSKQECRLHGLSWEILNYFVSKNRQVENLETITRQIWGDERPWKSIKATVFRLNATLKSSGVRLQVVFDRNGFLGLIETTEPRGSF
jgi:hypothetical protein